MFLAGIGLAIAESTIMKAVAVGGVRPDLAVMVVVVMALRADFFRAMVLGFTLGLVRDFLSGGAVGMNAFALTAMAYFLSFAKDFLMTDNPGSQMLSGFVGCVLFSVFFSFLKMFLQFEVGSVSRTIEMILWTSLYTALATPVAFVLMIRPRFPSYMRLKMKYDVEHETVPETKI